MSGAAGWRHPADDRHRLVVRAAGGSGLAEFPRGSRAVQPQRHDIGAEVVFGTRLTQSAATEWPLLRTRAPTTSPDSLRQVHFWALANFSILGAGSYAFPSVLLSSLLIAVNHLMLPGRLPSAPSGGSTVSCSEQLKSCGGTWRCAQFVLNFSAKRQTEKQKTKRKREIISEAEDEQCQR